MVTSPSNSLIHFILGLLWRAYREVVLLKARHFLGTSSRLFFFNGWVKCLVTFQKKSRLKCGQPPWWHLGWDWPRWWEFHGPHCLQFDVFLDKVAFEKEKERGTVFPVVKDWKPAFCGLECSPIGGILYEKETSLVILIGPFPVPSIPGKRPLALNLGFHFQWTHSEEKHGPNHSFACYALTSDQTWAHVSFSSGLCHTLFSEDNGSLRLRMDWDM